MSQEQIHLRLGAIMTGVTFEISAQQKTIDDQNKKISGLELSNETQQQQINDLLKRIEALEKK